MKMNAFMKLVALFAIVYLWLDFIVLNTRYYRKYRNTVSKYANRNLIVKVGV